MDDSCLVRKTPYQQKKKEAEDQIGLQLQEDPEASTVETVRTPGTKPIEPYPQGLGFRVLHLETLQKHPKQHTSENSSKPLLLGVRIFALSNVDDQWVYKPLRSQAS